MSFSISFLDGDTVNVVISAEWYDFEVGSDIVDNASADTVNVKVVRIHECHTAQEEYSAADFAQRLI